MDRHVVEVPLIFDPFDGQTSQAVNFNLEHCGVYPNDECELGFPLPFPRNQEIIVTFAGLPQLATTYQLSLHSPN